MLSGFGQVFKSDLHRSYLRPSAEQVSAWGGRNDPRDAREKKPVVPRVGIWGPLLESRKTSLIFFTPSSSAYLMASREQDLDSGLGDE